MCNKEGIFTGCKCKYICLKCLCKIIKYGQIIPIDLLNVKRHQLFYRCSTCKVKFDKNLINKIEKDRNIQKLKETIFNKKYT